MSKLKRWDGTLQLDHRVEHKDHNSRLQQLLGCNPTTDNLEKIKYQGKQWMSSWPRRGSCYHQTRSGWRLRGTADTAVHLLWVSLSFYKMPPTALKKPVSVQQKQTDKKKGGGDLPPPRNWRSQSDSAAKNKNRKRRERWNSEIDRATENYAPERNVI